MKNSVKFIIGVVLAYLGVGFIYSMAGYAQRAAVGKPEVFSPVFSVPVDMLFWPWSLHASIINHFWGPQVFITIVSVALALIAILLLLLSKGAPERKDPPLPKYPI